MSTHISLNGGDWQFKDFVGEDWRWRGSHKPGTRDVRRWRAGTVPGSVTHDLWQNSEIPNPYFERNSLSNEWIPQRTWLYKKSFYAGRELEGQRIRLCFKGVDYEAEFFLNGESLGAHRGMYTPATFEVGDRLQYGQENLVAVVIEAAPNEQPQLGRTSRVATHKARMNYGWDFCPRLLHQGIWDDVYLEITGPVRIADVFVRPQLSAGLDHADVSLSIDLDSTRQATVAVTTTLRFEGQVIASQIARHALAPGSTSLNVCLPVDQPRLWWPNGSGDQPLYEAEVQVEPSPDRRSVTFGIRTIEMAPNDTPDEAARPYTLVVNGRKLYLKGWNWAPMDVLYGVKRPEKLERLLTLARDAHTNLLRVWGGGLIERDEFYDLCDRFGILIWQEFIQSSSGIDNHPSESPEFVAMMAREAEQIIPLKRNHPSLALWCGGNELRDSSGRPLNDDAPALAALKAAVARLDPGRLWLPTSPSGRAFDNSLDLIARDPLALHDVHGPWEYQGLTQHYTLYNQGASLLHSEFGVEGITNLKTLNTVIAPERQWPVSLDNEMWHHLGAWWVKRPLWDRVWGEMPDVETMVHATQFLQADGLRYAVEADRRRKYHNSGSLPWQFNEPYPMAACTSAVDYAAQPKPAYYAVARAYEPIHVSAQFPTLAWQDRTLFEARLWANNSREQDLPDVTLEIGLAGASGRVYGAQSHRVEIRANSARRLAAFSWPLADVEDVFLLDLRLLNRQGSTLSRNRYVFSRTHNLAPLLAVPPATLAVAQEKLGDHQALVVTNAGNQAAMFVWLQDARAPGAEGYVYFDDNYFCLLPGESQRVLTVWRGAPPDEQNVEVKGWNTP